MPRRASTDDDEDAIASARRVVEQATGAPLIPKKPKAPKKNPHAQALSKLGASKCGVPLVFVQVRPLISRDTLWA